MQKFHIRIHYGNENVQKNFHYIYERYERSYFKKIEPSALKIIEKEAEEQFDKAVKELNYIYHDYGRFATTIAIDRLFAKFGFTRIIH